MIKLNNDENYVAQMKEALKKNDGYCPCALDKTENTKCMCKDFKDKLKDDSFTGFCHCKLYEKVKD